MSDSPRLPASSTFQSFLTPGLDRCAFISAWLRAREITHSIVELAGKRHIVARFPGDAYDPRFRMKTLVAHHDRAEGTPGANDNSAACFQLMLFAERLLSGRRDGTYPVAHNVRIFFTDGEEAAGARGIAGQGAFALGEGFRKLKMTDDDLFVFDACGRGDTLVLSTAGIARGDSGSPRSPGGKAGRGKLALRLDELHERAAEIAAEAASGGWLRLPTPYSDNAGFLAAGIAAQVITVLPRAEATRLLALGSDPALLAAIVANKRPPDGSPLDGKIPETWALMHTPNDAAGTLTASAFALMARFLDALARRMEPTV